MRFTANYHTHTTLCDGTNTPEEMARAAETLGMTHLGFSGHMDGDIHMDLPRYVQEIKRLQQQYAGRMDILLGVELDTLYDQSPAGKAYPSYVQEEWDQIEYVIGSTHFLDVDSEMPMSVDSSPAHLKLLCDQFFGGDYYRLAKAYYEVESQVRERTGCTFVGHFDLVTRFNDEMRFLDEDDPRYLTPALETMEYLVKQGLPFEINCGAVNRNRKKELYPNQRLLRALHAFGGEIVISADAHQKELLLGGFDIAVQRAIEAGFTHTNILMHDEAGSVVWRQVALR